MTELNTSNTKGFQNVDLEPTSRLLSVPQAAGFLGLGEKALRRRIERGQIEVVRIGRSVMLRRSDLLKIVREGCGLSPDRN